MLLRETAHLKSTERETYETIKNTEEKIYIPQSEGYREGDEEKKKKNITRIIWGSEGG